MSCTKIIPCLALVALVTGLVFTQEPGKEKRPEGKGSAPSSDAPATHKVEKKPFKIEVTVKGILEAEETAEISYRPHPMVQPPPSQGAMTIRKIVDHGAAVKKGDLLVALDTTKINEVIDDLEKDKKNLETNIRVAEEELPLFEKSMPVELAGAETAKKRADADLSYFLETGRPQMEKELEMYVKSAKFYVKYAEEELRQLEKMYKSNDLTEDTERMVLERQRNWLERAQFWYQSALIERDYMLKFYLPYKEKDLKDSQVKQDLALEKAKKTLAPTLTQKQNSLARMRFEQAKNLARLDKLTKDRDAMTIHAPMGGIVFHGKFHKGQWSGNPADSKLAPNGTISPDEVFLTIVKPRPLVVHLTVEEKDVYLVKPGLEGTAKVPVSPDRKLPARVTKVASVPAAPGKFEAQVALNLGKNDTQLMPGMACTVKFVPYSKKDAIAVPSSTIHEEDDKTIVYVLGRDHKHDKREVTTGRTDGEHTEILNGLREGEEILLERPGHKKADKDAPKKEDKKDDKEKGDQR